MKLIRQTILRFTKGASDKVYEVDLVETAGEYLVNFRYGKYDANLREGCKTKSPVELTKATKVADSLLVSKMNKGYQVISGYDPVSKQMIGEVTGESTGTQANSQQTMAMSSSDNKERNQKIIKRLEKYSQTKKRSIDGYELGRTIWKVGELRIKAALPAIEKILTSNVSKSQFDYYSILWTLGRIGEEKHLPLVNKLKNKIPENTEYMLTEVKMALSSKPAQFIPKYNDEIDIAETSRRVSQYDEIEQMSFSRLDSSSRDYINKVMDLKGVREDVESAVKQLTIEDANEDYVKKYLPEETLKILENNTAAFPKLEGAIDALLEHKKNTLITKQLVKYKADYDLYMSVIADLDLNKLFNGDDYEVSHAEQGKLDWMWGREEKVLRKALKKDKRVADVNRLWHRVESYSKLSSDIDKNYTDKDISLFKEQLEQADVAYEVLHAVEKYGLNNYSWSYKNDNLSNDVRSKYDSNLSYRVRELFDDRFRDLRLEALKPKKALTDTFLLSVVGTYWQSKADNSKRDLALIAVNNTPVSEPFTQAFRRLYKMAEFRDDAEALAILNYRIEATTPSPSSYWSDSKPFSKKTKEYFRRRMLRTLRNVAKFQQTAYTHYATQVLLQADDNDSVLAQSLKKQKITYFPRLSAMNYILHDNSIMFAKNSLGIWRLQRGVKRESAKPEAHPDLWNQAEGDLLELLLGCKAKIVNDFGYNKVHKKADFLSKVSQQDWITLVQKPYENTALLALDYLQDSLTDIEVMKAVLNSSFKTVRSKALEALDGESLGDKLELLALMLLSEHKDVFEFAKTYLYTAENQYSELSDQLLNELLAADKADHKLLIKRIDWLLLHPLKAKASLDSITPLLARSELEMQILGAKLLETSDYSFDEMEESYQLMSKSEYPEIRAGAIALLAKLSTKEKIKHKELLFNALLDEHGSLRQKSRDVIATIDDQSFRVETFDFVLPTFFKAEPVEGFADDMLELVVVLEPMHKEVEINLLWRLLNAKSKLAEWVGAVILPSRQAKDFSVKQLALLAKNPTVSVRDWAMDAFEADLSLTEDNYSQAIRLLDNRWDDTRSRAITFFKDNFEDHFWNSKRTIAVCDNVYTDVQRFGRELVTRFFSEDQGEEYLIKLSQHPSANVQLFVSGFLKEYASDQTEIILSLQPYFKTVLSQVNRGRLVKDRIISFLFSEAKKQESVATMVAELFSDQSVSMVIADKMQYIKTLFKLQTQFEQIQTPVVTIEPEIRETRGVRAI